MSFIFEGQEGAPRGGGPSWGTAFTNVPIVSFQSYSANFWYGVWPLLFRLFFVCQINALNRKIFHGGPPPDSRTPLLKNFDPPFSFISYQKFAEYGWRSSSIVEKIILNRSVMFIGETLSDELLTVFMPKIRKNLLKFAIFWKIFPLDSQRKILKDQRLLGVEVGVGSRPTPGIRLPGVVLRLPTPDFKIFQTTPDSSIFQTTPDSQIFKTIPDYRLQKFGNYLRLPAHDSKNVEKRNSDTRFG